MVLGDADRLRQLLLNLVVNALKYTPAGGEVTLGMRRSDGWVQVSVSDTGVGIAPEDLPHIFDRFYRADPSRARSGGSGLGLPDRPMDRPGPWRPDRGGERVGAREHVHGVAAGDEGGGVKECGSEGVWECGSEGVWE